MATTNGNATSNLTSAMIFAVVGIVLLPVITSFLKSTSFTGAAGSLIALIPMLYVVALIVGVLAYVLKFVK